ncbi:hyaluronan mediated motility receptor-like isoform X2 [Coccinella septempunctata]|uniref:hyaluronan mediated motility receptor-like isoform X2 n=1 Tax=Coccinella septempunctata TaxID=41139 RepID=UPI001D08EEB1|nr:hyaluronan mediated motility receptor-like isoform X2 [Coccinella septempunctata]
MSFPRAKIKRFNDIQAATPSPAHYNVDLKQKTKLGIIPQQERFTDCRSPPLSETGSTQSTPCFRTPTIVKRRAVLGSALKPKFQTSKLSDREFLHEKSVECKNKDTFIKELSEQLEEFKNKLYEIQCEKEAVSKEKEKFETEIFQWKTTHDAEIDILCVKHGIEVSGLNDMISKLESDLKLLKSKNELLNEEKEKLESTNHKKIYEYEMKISAKNDIIEKTQKTLEKMQEDKKIIEEKHKNEVEVMRNKHLTELQNLEITMLKSIHDMQMALDEQKLQSQLKVKEIENSFQNQIEILKVSFFEEKELINNQNIVTITQLEEKMNEIKLISEIQASEKCSELENYWKKKLENKEKESNEILKECQAISEYNIIQSEIEKNAYKSKFEESAMKYKVLEKKYDDVYLKYRKLQSSYSDAQTKLYRLIKEMRDKEAFRDQINQMIVEKQTYQLTISRCQQTIDILKDRLKESDHDVEQLKNEISNNEIKLLEYEHKFNIMSDELRDALALTETLELNNESNMKIAQEEVEKLKTVLLSKVEKFKLISEKNRIIHEEELHILREEREELLQMLEQHQVLNLSSNYLLTKANLEIEKLSSLNSQYSQQIENWKSQNDDLRSKIDDFVGKETSWTIEKKELDLKMDILKNEIKQMKLREADWKQSCSKVEEMEKKCENYKEKLSEKDSRITELEQEIRPIHIKYLKLEEQNEMHLKIMNIDLESKLRIQEKKLEKLTRENTDLKRNSRKIPIYEDKENIGSPNRSFKCDSPGPLKILN